MVVLAIDEDERVVVLRQYRHPAQMRLVELPAGKLDQPGEDPLVAAQRELREEAGLDAPTLDPPDDHLGLARDHLGDPRALPGPRPARGRRATSSCTTRRPT